MNKKFPFKNISIIGAGKTGISCAKYFSSRGYPVLLSDISDDKKIYEYLPKNVEIELGGHSEKILQSDLIIPCPDVSPGISVLRKAAEKNISILTDIEIFYLLARYKLIIAITGTNGKTTTTSMVGEILKNAGKKTAVCGNIGSPVMDYAPTSDEETYIVMEVSSYQLDYIRDFTPDIAAVLNITPDHLKRHKTMENYAFTKMKILVNQTGNNLCVINKDDELCRKIAEECNSAVRYFSLKENRLKIPLKIPGPHNMENALASIEISKAAGILESVIYDTLRDFPGVEHRLEFVREIKGVKYINDSKGTNVSSTEVAIKSFENPVILILGGRDKGSPYTPLIPLIKSKVKMIIAIGEAKNKIFSELKDSAPVILLENVDQAVEKAKNISIPGDIVLLSPACSSFDQFKNYEERGKCFKNIVNKLKV